MGNRPTNGQLAAIGIEMIVFCALTYFGIKWLSKVLDPTSKQKEVARQQAQKIISSLGLTAELSEYETSIAALLVDPLALPVSWDDIGGLESTIAEIKESVILPFRRRSLFTGSSLLSAPKGVLLYGPPGCGKTMIAKSTAKEAGCRFINLEVSSLTDKWYGESQKLVNAVFSLAAKIQPCIIFIDEIDSFLRARDSHDHEATAMMKAQFMSLWDGLMSDESTDIVIMAATNRPKDIDKAILRRLPCRFHVGLPDVAQRISIFEIILAQEILCDDVEVVDLATYTEGYTGSDIKELCRLAALQCLRRQVCYAETDDCVNEDDQQLNPINQSDFSIALDRMQKNNMILSKDVL